MKLLQSLFLGQSGNYEVAGIPISIYRREDQFDTMISGLSRRIREINMSGNGLTSSSIPILSDNRQPSSTKAYTLSSSVNSLTAILSQEYFFTFIHEMGHALAMKLLLKKEHPSVTIFLEDRDSHFFNKKVLGATTISSNQSSNWRNNIVLAAGPLCECVISGAQCLAMLTLGRYLPPLPAKILYSSVTIPFLNRSINAIYCFDDNSDFSHIRKNSYAALAIATGLVAGNVFAVVVLGRKINSIIAL